MSTANLDTLAARLTALRVTMADKLRKPVTEAGFEMQRVAKENATTVLHVRTGRLRASIHNQVETTGKGLTLRLTAGGPSGGGNVRYARIQELGGTIVPKNGQFLRIPLWPALTSAGVDRNPGPLRAIGGFYVEATDDGRLYLVPTQRGKGGRVAPPWYVLKTHVTLPARPYLRPAIEASKPFLVRGILATIRRSLGPGA